MPEGKGYIISAQKMSYGKPTAGSSAVHQKMKPSILSGKGPTDSCRTSDNKKMYKSKTGNK